MVSGKTPEAHDAPPEAENRAEHTADLAGTGRVRASWMVGTVYGDLQVTADADNPIDARRLLLLARISLERGLLHFMLPSRGDPAARGSAAGDGTQDNSKDY